jgi:2-succinyl-6-hydroxy-2,4-cyclohexadiene-1-carboxylate synthase
MSGLAFDRVGSGPRLVLIHGFTQNRRCWGAVADDLARDHEVWLVDAPGHGDSADVEADLVEGARLVAELTGDRPATFLGYSMGGRLCLQLALDHPAAVGRLILVGASPGIEDPIEREQRRAADDALARRLADLGLPAFLDEWLAQPLFAGLDAAHAFVRERLANTVAGLQSSLRLAGSGAQDPLWDRLGALQMPVLLVTGSADRKFEGIAEQMAARIPDARHVVIPDAGHTAHLENPDAFLTTVRVWLRGGARSASAPTGTRQPKAAGRTPAAPDPSPPAPG